MYAQKCLSISLTQAELMYFFHTKLGLYIELWYCKRVQLENEVNETFSRVYMLNSRNIFLYKVSQ